MKKFVSILVAMIMILSATAMADVAVPSKTTTDNTVVGKVESSTGVVIEESFAITVTPDAAPVAQEITKLFKAVTEEKKAPVAFFPEETKKQIVETLVAKLANIDIETVKTSENLDTMAAGIENFPDLEKMEINEFISITPVEYKEEYGDIETNFAFVTEYEVDQQVIVLFGLYTGEVDEQGEFIVEWVVLDATVEEDGTLTVVIPQAEMLKMQDAAHVAMVVLSEMSEVEELIAAE